MSHDSLRNKALVEFPNGKMLLMCEVSSSNVTDVYGKRVWDKHLVHPKDTLFYTKESLKKASDDYVSGQIKWLQDFNKEWYEKGYVDHYEEPTLDSYDYCGTVFPGGSRIRNGKAFYGGRPKKAEEYFASWDAPRTISFSAFDKDFHRIYEDTFDILRYDLDECYKDALKEHGQIYISLH